MEASATLTVRGRIVAGLGVGGRYVSHPYYSSVFTVILGCTPYPGTLNLETSTDWRELASKCVPEVIPEASWNGVRLGAVYVWRVSGIDEIASTPPTVLIRPLLSRHPSRVLELVSCGRLRDSLPEGVEEVTVRVACRPNPDYFMAPRLP